MTTSTPSTVSQTHYLVIVPSSTYGFAWGKGETIDAAKAACRQNGAKSVRKCKIYAVHPDTWIDECGATYYPSKNDRPKMIQDDFAKAA